jgi:hypothetical protein
MKQRQPKAEQLVHAFFRGELQLLPDPRLDPRGRSGLCLPARTRTVALAFERRPNIGDPDRDQQ